MSSAPDDRSGVRIFPPWIYLGGLFFGFLLHWRLPLPLVPALPPEEAAAHFVWLGLFAGMDLPASGAPTQQRPGVAADAEGWQSKTSTR